MSATLIQEDGTGLANSNTYANVAQAIAYASNLGVALPNADGGAQITTWLLTAMQFLESSRFQYVGTQLNPPLVDLTTGQLTPVQALSWPRANPYLQFLNVWAPSAPYPFPFNAQVGFVPAGVPLQIINAQCQLVLDQFNQIQVLPQSKNSGTGFVTLERFDILQTEYKVDGASQLPSLPLVRDFISSLLVPGAKPFLRIVKV